MPNNVAEEFYDSLAPGEALARCQQAAAQRRHRRGKPARGGSLHTSQKYATPAWDADCRRLKQAREAADALIVRRGGSVPYTPSYEEYEARWIAERQPQGETA